MIFKGIAADLDSMFRRDPAVRSRLEVLLCYPGFHALVFHRFANWLWRHRLRLAGRWISHLSRFLTGIEIHPAVKIGNGLFIDHGMGVVIGETTEIGNNVTIFQNATLGGTSQDRGKRHPTVEDDVVIGAGAKVLGPITVGAGAVIGSNAVVAKSVRPGASVIGVPAAEVRRRQAGDVGAFVRDVPTSEIPEPVARALEGLLEEVTDLRSRIALIEGSEGATPETADGHEERDRERAHLATGGNSSGRRRA